MDKKLARLTIAFAPEHEDLITGLLYINTSWGWQDDGLLDDRRQLTIHFDRPEQSAETEAILTEACPDLILERSSIDDTDWTTAWKQYFTPITVGQRFVVVPSWLANDSYAAETIVIEPKMAFGTGHHQTTALCLGGLDRLAAEGVITPGQRFLDLGTGSGILGIGAVKLGLTGIGLDIDPVAVDNARENAALNNVESCLELGTGSIDAIDADTGFDLILANILANPLIDMAEPITARLKEHGILVLSGILVEQAERVAEAYMAQGLPAPEITHAQEWALLVFRP